MDQEIDVKNRPQYYHNQDDNNMEHGELVYHYEVGFFGGGGVCGDFLGGFCFVLFVCFKTDVPCLFYIKRTFVRIPLSVFACKNDLQS